MNTSSLWNRYQKYLYANDALGLRMDISRMNFSEGFFAKMAPAIQEAFTAMDALEGGAIANPDENRMVGHYWLRDPKRAPSPEITTEIETTFEAMKQYTAQIHAEGKFKNLLIIGIGGSALGPQFVSAALTSGADKLKPFFFDNTDPDGMVRTLTQIGQTAATTAEALGKTLSIVISKSGGTPETRNGMLVAMEAYQQAGLDFAKHAVAITMAGSQLDKASETWLKKFPMWDWVGGRTSEISAVGLLPAALQGLDIDGIREGARQMDEATREKDFRKNPAMLLALMWHKAGSGKGKKDMVILPYKDRLELFSRYLQQLVMESIGKEKNLKGETVYQGIAVYGNKGSTDQHAYVQQLREGINNFFATFIEVLQDGGSSLQVEPDATCGDFLNGLFLGSRRALYENGRESITLTVPDVSALTVGRLIALYERAVGFYASLVGINAYHQPGVEAGKKAAANVLKIQRAILAHLRNHKGLAFSAKAIAQAIGSKDEIETVFKICEHLSANAHHGIQRQTGSAPGKATYQAAA